MKSDDDKEEEQQEEVEATAVLGWQLVVSRIVRLLLEKRTLSDRNRVLSKATCSLERGKAAEGKMWGRGVAFFSKKCFSSLCVLESLALAQLSHEGKKKNQPPSIAFAPRSAFDLSPPLRFSLSKLEMMNAVAMRSARTVRSRYE